MRNVNHSRVVMTKPNSLLRANSKRVLSAVGATSVAAGMMLVGAPSAFATQSCPVGSTEVTSGVCQVQYVVNQIDYWNVTTSYTFTPPAGISRLEVLLVGAGGLGYAGGGYSGGGGDVRVVELDTTGDVSVVVGRAPYDSEGLSTFPSTSVTQGSVNEVANNGGNASGGWNGEGADSGNEHTGIRGGGGAGGSAYGVEGVNGGPGVVVSSLVSSGSLFADDTDCFGGGGAWLMHHYTGDTEQGTASCGGAYPTGVFPDSLYLWYGEGLYVDAVANSGGGSMAYFLTGYPNPNTAMTSATEPAHGQVTFRFAYEAEDEGGGSGGSEQGPSDESNGSTTTAGRGSASIAETGSSALVNLAPLAGGLIFGGAYVLFVLKRLRSS